jgi:hypothetical protein
VASVDNGNVPAAQSPFFWVIPSPQAIFRHDKGGSRDALCNLGAGNQYEKAGRDRD